VFDLACRHAASHFHRANSQSRQSLHTTNIVYTTNIFALQVAAQQLELYSPYRVYMHRVLAQRCGTHEALATLLITFIQRASARGLVPAFEMDAGLVGPGVLPRVRVAGSSTDAAGVRCVQYTVGGALCHRYCLRSEHATWPCTSDLAESTLRCVLCVNSFMPDLAVGALCSVFHKGP
jgi:hypothetical protein